MPEPSQTPRNERTDDVAYVNAKSDVYRLTPECRIPFSHASLGWYEKTLRKWGYFMFRTTIGWNFYVHGSVAATVARNAGRPNYGGRGGAGADGGGRGGEGENKCSLGGDEDDHARVNGECLGTEAPLFPIDPYACVLTVPMHSRSLDVDVPRNFARKWFLNPDVTAASEEARRFVTRHSAVRADFGHVV